MGKFREVLLEVFDSPQKILKEYEKGNWKYFEFIVGSNKKYRVEFNTETYDEVAEIIFDRWDGDDWVFTDVTNDLDTKEVLQVFSTVIEVAKKNKLHKRKAIFCTTTDTHKSMVYRKLFKRMFGSTHSLSISELNKQDRIMAVKKGEDKPNITRSFKKFKG